MADHNDTGDAGEKIAADFLSDNKYKIRHRNWRFGKDEIDIIAEKGNDLVIVEVKTRRSRFYGEPEMAVTRQKQRFLIRATQAYVERYDLDLEVRFDIIAIVLSPNGPEINHIEDAFYPVL